MSYRIAVVGGGWYGCHLASSLLALGFSVKLFEQHPRLLHEASGNNQFRLHLGFHYPRHASTRAQSRDGFGRFLERYGLLTQTVKENLYVVPKDKSLLDFDTYKLIMTASGIPFQVVETCGIRLSNADGILKTDERVILIERARNYFMKHLQSTMSLSTPVEKVVPKESSIEINGESFDYAIDATWGHLQKIELNIYYEPTILLYVEAKPDLPAITFVDGPLYSIYPTEEKTIYTLSSVIHTPLARCATSAEARACRDSVNSKIVADKLAAMTAEALENIPDFRDQYRFLGPQLAIKTKPFGNSDDRSCYVVRSGRQFVVLSGKIDTIFYATERILSMIEADSDSVPSAVNSTLKAEIMALSGRLNV